MLLAQPDVPIGGWQDFLPYQQGVSVTQGPDKIYYATPLSIFSIDKEDRSVTLLSKVSGLSDVGVKQVQYDHIHDQLYVIYTNSNIDIISAGDILNIPNIKANTTITGSKQVNDIFIDDNGEAFMATDFGIIALNGSTLTFGATIQTGISVNELTASGSLIYAATDDGAYIFDRASGDNIADFSRWQLLGPDEGLPSLYSSKAIEVHKGLIYISVDRTLYRSDQDQSNWTVMHREGDLEVAYLESTEDRIIAGWQGPDFQSRVLFFDDDNEFLSAGDLCTGVPVDAIRDEQGRIWYADLFDRVRIASDYTATCEQTSYNSPFSEDVSDIVIREDDVLVASGGVAENFTFLFSREGFYLQQEGRWENFNQFDNTSIAALDLLNLYRVAFHPTLPKLYAGSYWAGLLEYDEVADTYTLYNKDNSTLRGSIGDPARERISGLVFDEEENLWVAAYNAPMPLNVLTPDGNWSSLPVPSLGTISDIVIDEVGNKWMPIQGSTGGILVMDSGESVDSPNDDIFRLINQNNSEMTTNAVRSVAVDLDGVVWVGTDEGPVIFDCGNDVFDAGRCQGLRRKVLQDSIGAFLLADQQINTIAVDGANQKWFGTRTGLFVQSPSGDDQIAHFTTDNSPLLNNEITALAYDGKNGLMWIGTNQGLMSLRTSSTTGANFFRRDEVYAFPNPVPPDYFGSIAIKGLVTDSNVKITDVNGLLVSELEAKGGQAIWDGKDLKGRDVASGVYLVFSTDDNAFDRPDSFATKILVIR